MTACCPPTSSKPDGYYENPREDMLEFIPAQARRTLEFGCGQGAFSVLLKERRGAETWAVEIEPAAARIAAERLDHVICADATQALDSLPDGYFDCIICFDVLEHLVDPYSLLVSLKTKLAPDGVIVTSIPNIRYYRVFVKFVLRGEWTYKDHGILDRTHLRFFTFKSILAMWRQLDFEVLLIRGIHPTSSRTCRLLQWLTFGRFWDLRYKHFVSVVKPRHTG